ncbi:MAG: hypothetical protein JJT76_07080 [Clostridiaceae bacterium]|nr:hypothetical protein [Clostridiaceae bacterium]
MRTAYFYASIIAVVILYVNTISVLKKVQKEEDTQNNAIIGSICLVVILVAVFEICGTYI